MLGACFVVAKCHKRPRLITSFYGIFSAPICEQCRECESDTHHNIKHAPYQPVNAPVHAAANCELATGPTAKVMAESMHDEI